MTPQERADELCAEDHDSWVEIVHCENLGEPVAETAAAFGVPVEVVQAIYDEQERGRKANVWELPWRVE